MAENHKPPNRIHVFIALIVCGLGVLIAYFSVTNSNQAVNREPVATEQIPVEQTSTNEVVSSAPETQSPPTPTHHYVLEQDGEYGYQPALSQNDMNDGVIQKPLTMVRYLGENNGRYTAIANAGDGVSMRVSCKNDCAFMKVELIYGGKIMKTETIQSKNTLGGGIMDDAIAGELKPFQAEVSSKKIFERITIGQSYEKVKHIVGQEPDEYGETIDDSNGAKSNALFGGRPVLETEVKWTDIGNGNSLFINFDKNNRVSAKHMKH